MKKLQWEEISKRWKGIDKSEKAFRVMIAVDLGLLIWLYVLVLG